jgi:hypothetical protein
VADPYATRTPDLSGRPDGPPPWGAEVIDRGGALIGPDGSFSGGEGPDFLVVPCCGIGTLAPFASVDPAMAVLLWVEHVADPREAAVANDLLTRLGDFGGPVFGVKQGSVGGPEDRPGCERVTTDLISRLLDVRESIAWERDPDFGYEVPARVPGMEDAATRILAPRLLYADHDRVYEHAGLVVDKKRERNNIASSVPGLDPTVGAAADWPPTVTSGDWRD